MLSSTDFSKHIYFVAPVTHGTAASTHSNTRAVLAGNVDASRSTLPKVTVCEAGHFENTLEDAAINMVSYPLRPPSIERTPSATLAPLQPPHITQSPALLERYGTALSRPVSECLRDSEAMLNEWLKEQHPPADIVCDLTELNRIISRSMSPSMTTTERHQILLEYTVLLERYVQVARNAVLHRQSTLEPDGHLDTCSRLEALCGHFNHEMQAIVYSLAIYRQIARCATVTAYCLYLDSGDKSEARREPSNALSRATRALLRQFKRVQNDIAAWGLMVAERLIEIKLAQPTTETPQQVPHVLQPRAPFEAKTDDEARCISQCYQDQADAIESLQQIFAKMNAVLERTQADVIRSLHAATQRARQTL